MQRLSTSSTDATFARNQRSWPPAARVARRKATWAYVAGAPNLSKSMSRSQEQTEPSARSPALPSCVAPQGQNTCRSWFVRKVGSHAIQSICCASFASKARLLQLSLQPPNHPVRRSRFAEAWSSSTVSALNCREGCLVREVRALLHQPPNHFIEPVPNIENLWAWCDRQESNLRLSLRRAQ